MDFEAIISIGLGAPTSGVIMLLLSGYGAYTPLPSSTFSKLDSGSVLVIRVTVDGLPLMRSIGM